MLNAKIRQYSEKKQKYCFELETAVPGKKGMKKYVFAVEKEYDYQKWVEALNTASKTAPTRYAAEMGGDGEDEEGNSPIHHKDSEDGDGVEMMSTNSSIVRHEMEMAGYLTKKSPNMIKGWQKRYFVLNATGDMSYYSSVRSYCALAN